MAELAVGLGVVATLGAAATLGNVAAVTQLVGNAGGLVSKINKEAKAARQNKVDCEHLASRVSTIGPVLSRLPRDPEVAPPLAELNKVLKEADRLVVNCQKGSTVFWASGQAENFKEVNARILSDMAVLILSLLSYIAHSERSESVGELISKITEAAEKARRSKLDCKNLARSVSTIRGVLSRLPLDKKLALAQPLADLKNTLLEAQGLVVGCQRRRDALKQLFRANRFTEINARIHTYVSIFPALLPSSERSNTLWPSLEMTGLPTELKFLEGIMIDANAEPGRLSYQFLRSITGNFSQEIGRGGFGVVYLGDLGTGKVAVKKLSISQSFSDTDFVDEIKCLIRTKHNNVVRFLGYCAETYGELVPFNGSSVMADVPQRLLCLEYVPNGNLQKYLQDKSHRDEWQIRYKMIRGICCGLNYLHGERINHLDLKPENILLDSCMEPKITDFGLSRCFDEGVSTVYTKTVRGTLGCIAPETINCGEITFKSDIYGLGIIIIKLLTGHHVYDFQNWPTTLDVDSPQVKSCIEIALTCVVLDQHERPSIVEIMQKLNEIEKL